MRALGFEVTENIGKTGLAAIYKNGDGPTIMVRTELDALPMEEKTVLPMQAATRTNWNGQDTFVAHSCGPRHSHGELGRHGEDTARPEGSMARHADVHRPARRRKRCRAPGRCWRTACSRDSRSPTLDSPSTTDRSPYGTISYRVGIGSSNSDSLEITFHGRGGHGAARQRTIDPVMIAARFIVDLQA